MNSQNAVLVVSAARFEAEPLLERLQQLSRAGQLNRPVVYAACGVGALAAAKAANHLAELSRGKDVIFVGTAGAFAGFTAPRLLVIDRVVWEPTCVRSAIAYTVANTAPDIPLSSPLTQFESLPRGVAVCTPAVSKVAATSQSDFAEKPRVENLELYSCAAEIAEVARSFTAVLCTTNAVGPESHVEWKRNFPLAAKLTAETLAPLLKDSSQ